MATKAPEIIAINNGTVSYVSKHEIKIEHPDKSQSCYLGLSRVDVVVGQKVVMGEPIGLSVTTGTPDGKIGHIYTNIKGENKTNRWTSRPLTEEDKEHYGVEGEN